MIKKIISIFIVCLFLAICFSNISLAHNENISYISYVDTIAKASARIGATGSCSASIPIGQKRISAGDYRCKYSIEFNKLIPVYQASAKGELHITCYVGTEKVFKETIEIDYDYNDKPDDIVKTKDVYIPPKSTIEVTININLWYDIYYNNDYQYSIYEEDSATRSIHTPKLISNTKQVIENTTDASHVWDEKDIYIIRAKAKDSNDAKSDWATLEVSMPKNKAINTPFLQFLENHPRLFPLLRQLLKL